MAESDVLDDRATVDTLTRDIIGSAIEVHRHLGPGLLESTYEECLASELCLRGIVFKRQVWLPLEYKGLRLARSYSVDLLIADLVILELKTVEKLLQVHESQVLTYMRLSGCQAGLLVNFNERVLKDGIRRFNLTRPVSPSSPPSKNLSAQLRPSQT